MPALSLTMPRTRLSGVAALFLLAGVALAVPAGAQEAGGDKAPIKLQLNKLENVGEACRSTMVIDNRGAALKSFKVDLFAFDTDGVAQKRVAVDLGPIAARKTVVKLLDFQGIGCAKVGRVLLNDVIACDGGEAAREGCLDRTEVETKTTVPFDR